MARGLYRFHRAGWSRGRASTRYDRGRVRTELPLGMARPYWGWAAGVAVESLLDNRELDPTASGAAQPGSAPAAGTASRRRRSGCICRSVSDRQSHSAGP
jgi:hypothetical protein